MGAATHERRECSPKPSRAPPRSLTPRCRSARSVGKFVYSFFGAEPGEEGEHHRWEAEAAISRLFVGIGKLDRNPYDGPSVLAGLACGEAGDPYPEVALLSGASVLIRSRNLRTPSPLAYRTTPYSMTRCVGSRVDALGGKPASSRVQRRGTTAPSARTASMSIHSTGVSEPSRHGLPVRRSLASRFESGRSGPVHSCERIPEMAARGVGARPRRRGCRP